MTSADETAASVLAALSREKIPLTVDITELASKASEPRDGEDAGAFTDRVLREGSVAAPGRRRQCSIGYHGECSDREGSDGCTCLCHPLLTRLHRDHPVLHQVRSAMDTIMFCGGSKYSAWATVMDLHDLGLGVVLSSNASVYVVAENEKDEFSELLYGETGLEGDEFVREVMAALSAHGVQVERVERKE